jgi:hypothetical protein
MHRVYSKLHGDKLIYTILRGDDISEARVDLSPSEEYIQACGRVMSKGTKVKAHRHLRIERVTDLTQEAWVIVRGKVLARFYDLDGSFMCEEQASSGDVVCFYRGGHSLEVLEDDTLFYEFKNGHYLGVAQDKEAIDE